MNLAISFRPFQLLTEAAGAHGFTPGHRTVIASMFCLFAGLLWRAPTTSPPPRAKSSSCAWSSPPPSRRSVRLKHPRGGVDGVGDVSAWFPEIRCLERRLRCWKRWVRCVVCRRDIRELEQVMNCHVVTLWDCLFSGFDVDDDNETDNSCLHVQSPFRWWISFRYEFNQNKQEQEAVITF